MSKYKLTALLCLAVLSFTPIVSFAVRTGHRDVISDRVGRQQNKMPSGKYKSKSTIRSANTDTNTKTGPTKVEQTKKLEPKKTKTKKRKRRRRRKLKAKYLDMIDKLHSKD